MIFVNAIDTSPLLMLPPRCAEPSESLFCVQSTCAKLNLIFPCKKMTIRVNKAIYHYCDGRGNFKHVRVSHVNSRDRETGEHDTTSLYCAFLPGICYRPTSTFLEIAYCGDKEVWCSPQQIQRRAINERSIVS